MKINKQAEAIGILTIIFIISVFLIRFYPKSVTRFPVFILLFLIDIYLWSVICRKIKSFKPWQNYLLTSVYWLPFLSLLLISLAGLIFNYTHWNNLIRNYLIGGIIMVYLSKVIASLLLLFFDVFRLILSSLIYIFKRIKTGRSVLFKMRPRKRSVAILCFSFGLLLFLVLSGGVFKGVYKFRVKEQIIHISDLPKGFDGFKIVQFSDLHLGNWASYSKLEEFVSIVNKLHPDIILFTGDLVNYQSDEAYPFGNILSQLQAPMGVYCILGNHDYGDYYRWRNDSLKKENMKGLEDFYKRIKWKLLRNENRLLIRGKDTVTLIGVENWGSMKRFKKRADMSKALQGMSRRGAELLMSHDPSHWDKEVSMKYPDVDLTFSGHTHGMQFGIKTKNINWSPVKLIYKHWSGLYSVSHKKGKVQYLYVNTGLGNIIYPGRVGIIPEITLFTLYTGPSSVIIAK